MAKEPSKVKVHKGFEYREIAKGLWEIVFPSGLVTKVTLSNEDIVVAYITMLTAELTSNKKKTRRYS